MSIPVTDSEGFIKVDRKKRKKVSRINVKTANFDVQTFDIAIPEEAFYMKFVSIKSEMFSSEFMSRFQFLFLKALKYCEFNNKDIGCEPKPVVTLDAYKLPEFDIVCYGLGKFLSCANAQHQLAFLVILSQKFLNQKVYVYDPLFSAEEVKVLKEFKFCVLEENEEGKRTVMKPTVFYMPHCGKPLYNSLLWANWSVNKLPNIVIIGNSIKNMADGVCKKNVSVNITYLLHAGTFVEELSVPNIYKYSDIFNSMSIHVFETPKLLALSDSLWSNVKEPCYSTDDEIIRKIDSAL